MTNKKDPPDPTATTELDSLEPGQSGQKRQIERQEIRVFAAVMHARGFGRAAEQLGVSQSAVSQTIARLEDKVGTALVLRNHQPELTEAGLRFMKFARTVINEEAATLEDLASLRSGALSTLNLAMNSMVNRIYGHQLLLTFCDDYPLTRLKLDVAPSREIIYGVDEGRWELGFGPFLHQMPGHFTSITFFSEQRTLVVHQAHPMANELLGAQPQALPGLLSEVPLLTSYLDDAAKRPGLERLRNQFASVWEVSNLELRLALAASGKGVTYLSNHLLEELSGFEPVKGSDISLIERDVGLCYKTDAALSEGAKRFIGICQRRFPPTA